MQGITHIVVFSHLRWEFVWQRPQHILSRLAKDTPVLFIEEPVQDGGVEDIKVISAGDGVTVVQPRFPISDSKKLAEVVKKFVPTETSLLWFYSPMFVDVLSQIKPAYIVFDVMDELSAFRGAPPELLVKEQVLFNHADVVFTGGKSLYASKLKRHSHVYCFPSSVEREHFASAMGDISKPHDLQNVSQPIVGYYGVVDERIDMQLLSEVARQKPEVTFVMVGPVVKISETDLARETNIVYVGGKNYKELPAYLKYFSICMMPFALNESTRFISPTKTLEYMAAQKPIISTPITDVVRTFNKEVRVVRNADEFVAAINYFLREPLNEMKQRVLEQMKTLDKTSWDITVTEMKKIISHDMTATKRSTLKAGETFATL